ncbi:MAG TPA: TonB-dependent receptor [Steroidobacteraceae bacterium]|nr:TonB-dependent receptor [Steroidobacteraceae bacterium]
MKPEPVARLCRAVVSAVIASGVTVVSMAQSAPQSGALDEVVVTSRRVAERLQDTPISVSAFRAADIEKLSIRNVGDAASFTPNFISNPGPTGGNDGFFFIRGVGQTDLNPATDPGVGTYVDGVYLGRVMGASMDSADVARIEVLRGPQGTLFGRNTIGGAVNITTRDPGEEFAADLMVGAGSRSLVTARASVDIPVSDNAGLIVSAAYRDQDGWGKRPDGVRMDSNKSTSGRAKFRWAPTDDFTLTLAADVTQLTGTSQHTILTRFNSNIISPLGVPLAPGIGAFANPADPYLNQSSITPDKDYDVKGAGLILDWNLGWGNLKSITSYRELQQFITTDYDSTPFSFYEGGFDTDQDQLSQELQISGETGRFKWLLGGFYYDETDDHVNIVSLGGNNGCNPLPFGPPPACNFAAGQQYATPGVDRRIINNQAFKLDIKAYALFAHTTIALTDTVSGSVGVRWTDEEKTQDYDFFIDNRANVFNLAGLPPAIFPTLSRNNPFLPPTTPTVYNKSWSQVTPKFGLEWKPQAEQLYYLSFSRGFKSGGFNGRPNPVDVDGPGPLPPGFLPIEPYDPEEIDTYEIGAKTQLADNRVRFNVAAFQSDYQGIQLLGLGASGFFETINAAEARIRGAELELLARPTPEFELQLGLGYTESEYQKLNPGTVLAGINFGMQLPLTPKWNGSLGAQYEWALPRGSFTLRGDYSFRSELYFEAANGIGNRQGGYGVFNARATYELDNGLQISAYGLNLGDQFYLTNAQDVVGILGVSFASISSPREFGLEVRYKFGK